MPVLRDVDSAHPVLACDLIQAVVKLAMAGGEGDRISGDFT
jgi:hypothetical protein